MPNGRYRDLRYGEFLLVSEAYAEFDQPWKPAQRPIDVIVLAGVCDWMNDAAGPTAKGGAIHGAL